MLGFWAGVVVCRCLLVMAIIPMRNKFIVRRKVLGMDLFYVGIILLFSLWFIASLVIFINKKRDLLYRSLFPL
ncbi:hypothetical protein NIES208_07930 [[Limnothrix rosea] IAM M-220]|nr:hypothetical protein NIES208_07930 [[Limnothrix rosea] IAM M-220]